jgi:hypothetical protein
VLQLTDCSILARSLSDKQTYTRINSQSQSKEDISPDLQNVLAHEGTLTKNKVITSRWKLKYLFENIPMIVMSVFGLMMNLSGVLLQKTNYSFMSYVSCYYFILFVSVLFNCYNYESISSQLNLCVGAWMLGFIVSILTYFFSSAQHIIKGTCLASSIILVWVQIQSNRYAVDQLKYFFVGYLSIIIVVLVVSSFLPFFMMTLATTISGTIVFIFHLMVLFEDATPFQETDKEDAFSNTQLNSSTYGYIVGAMVMFGIGFSFQLILFKLTQKGTQRPQKSKQVTKS